MSLALRCPECARLIRVPLMRSATVVVRRKCRGCASGWRVKVEPLVDRPGFLTHRVSWWAIVPDRDPQLIELKVDE